MPVQRLAERMRVWATHQRSLAAYNERAGKHDVRTALLGSALTVEGWAAELEALKKEPKGGPRRKVRL